MYFRVLKFLLPQGGPLDILLKITLGLVWIITLFGLGAVIFTKFQFDDLNFLALFFLGFAVLNTFLMLRKKA